MMLESLPGATLFLCLAAAAVPPAAQESAAGTVAAPVDRSVDYARFQGPQRSAIELCAPRIERFGRMRIDDVRPHGRSGTRVYGTVNDGGGGLGYGYGLRRGYGLRAFTCTVDEDGRVKLKTSRLRR